MRFRVGMVALGILFWLNKVISNVIMWVIDYIERGRSK